jgi:hypothetical protein
MIGAFENDVQTSDITSAPAGIIASPYFGYNHGYNPFPPAGIFDARFSSGQYVQNLAGGQKIHISSAQYPIRLKAQNLQGRVIQVKDLLGGNALDATLPEGQAIVVAKALDKTAVTANLLPAQFALSQNYPNPFNRRPRLLT